MSDISQEELENLVYKSLSKSNKETKSDKLAPNRYYYSIEKNITLVFYQCKSVTAPDPEDCTPGQATIQEIAILSSISGGLFMSKQTCGDTIRYFDMLPPMREAPREFEDLYNRLEKD